MEHSEIHDQPDSEPYRGDVPIQDSDIDSSFKYEVADQIGGEGLLRCLKCGACSGGCPVGSVIDYRPRKVLGNVLLGLKEHVLSSEDIWLCAGCFTCEERCVQEVNFTDIVTVLRNMAVKQGRAPQGYVNLAQMVMEHGRVSARTKVVDKMREKLGLPPLQEPAIDDIKSIFESTGFKEILDGIRKEDESK